MKTTFVIMLVMFFSLTGCTENDKTYSKEKDMENLMKSHKQQQDKLKEIYKDK
ncbi:MAG: hypothetical protein Q8L93_02635 [Rhodocyclaceae bacterium]|nr:hypothetical protein [Rhodocyclaceae bacterium]